MKIKLTVIGAALLLGVSLQAGTTFNFTGSDITPTATSTIPTQTLGGIGTTLITDVWASFDNSGTNTVEQTAAQSSHLSANFQTNSWIGEYSGAGVGVCNPNEQSACAQPQHQIDNYSGLDFVLFAFNSAVSLSSVQIANFGNPTGTGTEDMDLSYALLSATQESNLLAGNLAFNTSLFSTVSVSGVSGTTPQTINLSGVTQYLLIGTAVTGNYGGDSTPDAFKIQDLTVNPVSGVPEPASFVLIGSGLLAGAFFGRRRIFAKSIN